MLRPAAYAGGEVGRPDKSGPVGRFAYEKKDNCE